MKVNKPLKDSKKVREEVPPEGTRGLGSFEGEEKDSRGVEETLSVTWTVI